MPVGTGGRAWRLTRTLWPSCIPHVTTWRHVTSQGWDCCLGWVPNVRLLLESCCCRLVRQAIVQAAYTRRPRVIAGFVINGGRAGWQGVYMGRDVVDWQPLEVGGHQAARRPPPVAWTWWSGLSWPAGEGGGGASLIDISERGLHATRLVPWMFPPPRAAE